jgi:hypothetical protein
LIQLNSGRVGKAAPVDLNHGKLRGRVLHHPRLSQQSQSGSKRGYRSRTRAPLGTMENLLVTSLGEFEDCDAQNLDDGFVIVAAVGL